MKFFAYPMFLSIRFFLWSVLASDVYDYSQEQTTCAYWALETYLAWNIAYNAQQISKT